MAKNKKLHIGFVLDETGSMYRNRAQTISGFNEYVETLRQQDNADDIRFTLIRFNSEKRDVELDGVKLKKVPELTSETYRPKALTPLYDAVGYAIEALKAKVSGKETALLMVQTDGEENDSEEYDQASIKALVDAMTDKGWTFGFMGADIDVWDAALMLGVPKGNVMQYSAAESKAAFRRAAGSTVSHYTSRGGAQSLNLFSDEDSSNT